MSDLDALYKQIVIDHYRNPRNRGTLETPPALHAEGLNPLCGDHFHMYVCVEDGVISDIKFDGVGCSISMASASMLTAAVKNSATTDAETLTETFKAMLSQDCANSEDYEIALGDLASLQGVKQFPVRIKCALLAWDTLNTALAEQSSD